MDHLLKIEYIIHVLTEAKELDYSEEITDLKCSASTGSELLMSITHTLKRYIEENEKIKGLVGGEVQELVDFCNSIGLSIK